MNSQQLISSYLIGEKDENRTELFSRAIVNAEFGYVLYVSKAPFDELPRGLSGTNFPNKEFLKRLTFLYSLSVNDLVESLSQIHTWNSVPSTIIVEGFQDYCSFEKSPFAKAAMLSAYLIDTASACGKRLKGQCKVIVSFNADVCDINCNNFKTIIELYFHNNISQQ